LNRIPLLRRPLLRRRLTGAATAGLLLGALLVAGCGEDNQRVPENFPSGARPAPLPAVDLAAGAAELPPPPPAEPEVQPTLAVKNPAAELREQKP
jgi:hypothetical protein